MVALPSKEKHSLALQQHKQISKRQICTLLNVNRSSLYNKLTPKQGDTTFMNEIHKLWIKIPFYGYRRITAQLRRNGYKVNHKRVIRLMKEMNLKALYPKKKKYNLKNDRSVHPYLLRGLSIDHPNHVWATDITYIRLPQGFVYLICLIDVYSRFIVAWELSNSLDNKFCLRVLDKGLLIAKPEIVNTDQGVQFTSFEWLELLKKNNIKISMDGVGRCLDNIFIERFWRTLKYENLALMPYESMIHARIKITNFIKFYNNERLHSSLEYQTPAEAYFLKNEKEINNAVHISGMKRINLM